MLPAESEHFRAEGDDRDATEHQQEKEGEPSLRKPFRRDDRFPDRGDRFGEALHLGVGASWAISKIASAVRTADRSGQLQRWTVVSARDASSCVESVLKRGSSFSHSVEA